MLSACASHGQETWLSITIILLVLFVAFSVPAAITVYSSLHKKTSGSSDGPSNTSSNT